MVSTCLQARVVIVYVTAERLSFLESNIMCSRQDFFADPIVSMFIEMITQSFSYSAAGSAMMMHQIQFFITNLTF